MATLGMNGYSHVAGAGLEGTSFPVEVNGEGVGVFDPKKPVFGLRGTARSLSAVLSFGLELNTRPIKHHKYDEILVKKWTYPSMSPVTSKKGFPCDPLRRMDQFLEEHWLIETGRFQRPRPLPL